MAERKKYTPEQLANAQPKLQRLCKEYDIDEIELSSASDMMLARFLLEICGLTTQQKKVGRKRTADDFAWEVIRFIIVQTEFPKYEKKEKTPHHKRSGPPPKPIEKPMLLKQAIPLAAKKFAIEAREYDSKRKLNPEESVRGMRCAPFLGQGRAFN